MRTIDYDGRGPRRATASAYTLMVYEQEFGHGMLGDYMQDDPTGVGALALYNSLNVLRGLWAMLRTANAIDEAHGRDADEHVPGFDEWLLGVGAVNIQEVTEFVDDLIGEGLFRQREPEAEEPQR